ncbi:MAG: ABC transporter permease subunit [Deltaproteobacteria bacterium]|nr:ABC transporter permease subunit [Deltaproteobacteria bacterium]
MRVHLFADRLFSLSLSFKIVFAALPILLLVAMLISFWAMNARGSTRLCIDVCLTLPIIFPPIGIGFLLVYLFGAHGILGQILGIDLIFSFPGLVLAACITGIPFIAQPIVTGMDGRLINLCEASHTMGKGRTTTFFRLVLPLLKSNIIAGALLASARILGEVGISLMIGGNIKNKTNTISLEIYNAVLDGENHEALVLSLFLIVISILIFSLIRFLTRKETW